MRTAAATYSNRILSKPQQLPLSPPLSPLSLLLRPFLLLIFSLMIGYPIRMAFAFTSSLSTATPSSRSFLGHYNRIVPTRTSSTAAMSTFTDDENDPNRSNRNKNHLLLVGGGHAHVQVIKSLNWASRPRDLQVTLVDLSSKPRYSGMVPGAVAGLYTPLETEISLAPLAKWAGIHFVQGQVTDIQLHEKVAEVLVNDDDESSESATTRTLHIPFDAISLDIGSSSRGIDQVPGAQKHTIPTRPIADLVVKMEQETTELEHRVANAEKNNKNSPSTAICVRAVVVGGGAAGVELAMALWGRWKPILMRNNDDDDDDDDDDTTTNTNDDNHKHHNCDNTLTVTILDAGKELFPQESSANRQALLQRLTERGIEVLHEVKVDRVNEDSLVLQSGDILPFTHCLWATGATAHPLATSLRQRGLPVLSDRGWIRVNQYLQSVDSSSYPYIFAAGDCCTMERTDTNGCDLPPPPKAGVFAVRAGPILIENLVHVLYPDDEKSFKPYVPQDDFLKLVICGDGKALGFRFGIPLYGKWVFQLKDAIDRSFMDLFKEENLPTLEEGQPYDMSQYDATGERPKPMYSVEAADLLQRTDDNVDFQVAWNILRDMAQDDHYREAVLKHIIPASKVESL